MDIFGLFGSFIVIWLLFFVVQYPVQIIVGRVLFRDQWLENSSWVMDAGGYAGLIYAPLLNLTCILLEGVGRWLPANFAPFTAGKGLVLIFIIAGVGACLLIVCNLVMACLVLRKSLGTWLVLDPWARGDDPEVTDLKRRVVGWSVFSVIPGVVILTAALIYLYFIGS